jgi:nucleoid-associated protein YgaU
MLNKDQYNQDEYNDYYAQETRGAEISGSPDDGGGGGKKKMILILLLLAIVAVGAYFGWKNMGSTDTTPDKNISSQTPKTDGKIVSKEDNSTKETAKDINKSVTKEATKDTKPKSTPTSKKDEVTKEVQTAISNDNTNAKMNPEDIANIVQMVMQKMNREKANNPATAKPTRVDDGGEGQQNSKLQKSLDNVKVDSLSSEIDSTKSISETDSRKKASTADTTDTYNKVVLSKSEKDAKDELSKLSTELSNVINEDDNTKKDTSEYTKVVKKEVKERTKEMRYVTVKKGDTLGKIAKRVYGNVMDYKKIYKANPDILKREDKIYINQRLRVPE